MKHFLSLRMPRNIFAILLTILISMCASPLQCAPLRQTAVPANFGVNIHFLDRNIEKNIVLLKEAGFGWVRKDLNWANIEKEQGVYDFTKYDALIRELNTANIKVLLILNYSNDLYDSGLSPYTNLGRRAFCNFVRAAALRYAHNNVAWEIYNEPNLKFWTPAPNVENYNLLAADVTQTLKQTVPNQAILAPALAGPTPEKNRVAAAYKYLDAVLQNPTAKQWDGISVHTYRIPYAPETVMPDIQRLNKMLHDHQITSPLIISEWGYHTANNGVDEETQAAYAVRSLLISASLRMPFSILYSWQDTGTNDNDGEENFGILRNGNIDLDDSELRKPAFLAVRQLTTSLSGYTFDKAITAHNGIYCLRFKKGKNLAYAVWSTDENEHNYDLELSAGDWQLTPILSQSSAISVQNGAPVSLQLAPLPLMVTPINP